MVDFEEIEKCVWGRIWNVKPLLLSINFTFTEGYDDVVTTVQLL